VIGKKGLGLVARIPPPDLYFLLLSLPKCFCQVCRYLIWFRFMEDLFQFIFSQIDPIADLQQSFEIPVHQLADGFRQYSQCLFLGKFFLDFRELKIFGNQTERFFRQRLTHWLKMKKEGAS